MFGERRGVKNSARDDAGKVAENDGETAFALAIFCAQEGGNSQNRDGEDDSGGYTEEDGLIGIVSETFNDQLAKSVVK